MAKLSDKDVEKILQGYFERTGALGKPFEEIFAAVEARCQAEKEAKEVAAKDFSFEESGAQSVSVCRTSRYNRRRTTRNKIWISSVATAMSAVLFFSFLGIFLYFHNRDSGLTEVDLPDPDNLLMTASNYETLSGLGVFVPNFSGLNNVIIARGEDKDTGVTKLFRVIGYFYGSRMTMRIVVYDDFVPDDARDFEEGRLIEVEQHFVRVVSAQSGDAFVYRLFSVENKQAYYIVFETRYSGGYLPLLNSLLG